jgi:hypothetical protein
MASNAPKAVGVISIWQAIFVLPILNYNLSVHISVHIVKASSPSLFKGKKILVLSQEKTKIRR